MVYKKYTTKELKEYIEFCEDKYKLLTPHGKKKLSYFKLLYKSRMDKYPEAIEKIIKIDLEPNNLTVEI